MPAFIIKGDLAPLEAALRSDVKKARIAAVVSMNKAVTQMRSQATRLLSKRVKLPSRAVRSRLKVVKGYDRPGRRYAALVALTQPFPIDRLAPRDLKRGGFAVAGRRFPHAFRTFGRRGSAAQQRLIFQRATPATKRSQGRASTSSPNLPIERVGIPIADEAYAVIRPIYGQYVGYKLGRLFEHEISRRGVVIARA